MKKNYNGPVLIFRKDQLWEALIEFPSIQFGVEVAFQSLHSETLFLLFPSNLLRGQNQFKSMVSFGWVKPLL
jgi:hypothetical protein